MTIGPPVGNHTVGNGGRVTILDHDGAVGLFHAKFVFWWIQYHPGMFFGVGPAGRNGGNVETRIGSRGTDNAVARPIGLDSRPSCHVAPVSLRIRNRATVNIQNTNSRFAFFHQLAELGDAVVVINFVQRVFRVFGLLRLLGGLVHAGLISSWRFGRMTCGGDLCLQCLGLVQVAEQLAALGQRPILFFFRFRIFCNPRIANRVGQMVLRWTTM